MTEAFTWVSTTFLIGISAGVALAGIVADHAGPHAAFWLAVAGGLFSVGATFIRHTGLYAMQEPA